MRRESESVLDAVLFLFPVIAGEKPALTANPFPHPSLMDQASLRSN